MRAADTAHCPPAFGTSPPGDPIQAFGDLGQHWFESAAECWSVAAHGVHDWLGSLIRRGATPLDAGIDLARWIELVSERRRPRWAHPNRVVLETPVARLRDFSDRGARGVVPTLVVPPQAGHDSCIVDYSPRQSQLQVLKAAGLRRLWSLDWVGAGRKTRDASIEDYLEAIDRSVERIGAGRLNLVGDCQGGWLATVWAALHPERINTLTIAGAPIDFHAGEPVIHDYVEALTPIDLAFYRAMVALGGGVMKGDWMVGGFITIRPESEIEKQIGLLANLDDDQHVERYRTFEDWFKYAQDIPGAFYLWIVEHLFLHNRLARGTLEIGGQHVDLGRIDAPVLLLAGAKDHITPADQVYALAEHVSTPKRRVRTRMTSGGHLGLFMGGEALREHWPPLMAEVYAHSRPGGRRPQAARRARAATPRAARAIPSP
ncbi:MAG: alpha/beta fold hydrolase [Nocardioidaceae bacterium]